MEKLLVCYEIKDDSKVQELKLFFFFLEGGGGKDYS